LITRVEIKNFKRIENFDFQFTPFDLLSGYNNCGKSSVLQALAIWQFCIEEFLRDKRKGSTGKQVVLPNFTAVPVPEFNLLWYKKINIKNPAQANQERVLIDIKTHWRHTDGNEFAFGIKMRYTGPQSAYVIPANGWEELYDLNEKNVLPKIVYVPPFSGLETKEQWRDEGPVKGQIGRAQPGSVLRNLLLRVEHSPLGNTSDDRKANIDKYKTKSENWAEIESIIRRWFSVEVLLPQYTFGVSENIICEYRQDKKNYDIISGGSGFHQILTLLAFLYGYNPTTVLYDEPDAHLHVNLQREVLDYFKEVGKKRGIQFIIATHAEEFIKGVDTNRLISMLQPEKPIREATTADVLSAMAIVTNIEITNTRNSPFILYVEGEDDERIIRRWSTTLAKTDDLKKFFIKTMHGGNKQLMKADADNHYSALKKIVPNLKRLMVFDFDNDIDSFHPDENNPVLFEWTRKNIENYLLIPDIWIKAVRSAYDITVPIANAPLFFNPINNAINEFFSSEGLNLPKGRNWQKLDTHAIKSVDGKKLLFEANNSLFNKLRSIDNNLSITREGVASMMTEQEMHQDILHLFNKIETIILSDDMEY